jgi:lambda repressor-like predicted transcriptional regulator
MTANQPTKKRTRTVERHGMTGTPEYRAWSAMRRRCNKHTCGFFYLYGARGINICPEWSSFKQFFADIGPRPGPEYSIGRIDNDLGYSPDNCRWENKEQQSRNTRRSRLISYNGKTQCRKDWAEEYGIDNNTLKQRLEHGWSMQEALTLPAYEKHPRYRLVSYRDRTQTVSAWAREYGLDFRVLFYRLNHEWSVEEALNTARYGVNHKKPPMTYLGKTQTSAAWAREYGISKSTLRNRIVKGWSIKDALTTPPSDRGFHRKPLRNS